MTLSGTTKFRATTTSSIQTRTGMMARESIYRAMRRRKTKMTVYPAVMRQAGTITSMNTTTMATSCAKAVHSTLSTSITSSTTWAKVAITIRSMRSTRTSRRRKVATLALKARSTTTKSHKIAAAIMDQCITITTTDLTTRRSISSSSISSMDGTLGTRACTVVIPQLTTMARRIRGSQTRGQRRSITQALS